MLGKLKHTTSFSARRSEVEAATIGEDGVPVSLLYLQRDGAHAMARVTDARRSPARRGSGWREIVASWRCIVAAR